MITAATYGAIFLAGAATGAGTVILLRRAFLNRTQKRGNAHARFLVQRKGGAERHRDGTQQNTGTAQRTAQGGAQLDGAMLTQLNNLLSYGVPGARQRLPEDNE